MSFASDALTLTAGIASTGMLQNVSGNNTWNGTITTTGSGNFTRIASDTGMLTLANSNAITSSGTTVELQGAGAILVRGKITGTSGLLSSATGSGVRTVSDASNDFAGTVSISGGTLSVKSIKNINVASALGKQANATNATIGIGGSTSTGTLSYSGTGDTSDRVINLSGTTGGATVDQSGASGNLKFTSDLTATGAGSKTLTLQGSTGGTGEIGGAIVDNSSSNKTSLTKAGSGNWTLAGANSYTSVTKVNGGTLALGVSGSIANSSAIASGATLDVSAVSSWTVGASSAQKLTGSGGVTGAATIGSSGIHNAGDNSVGKQTFSSNLDYANSSIFEWNLAAVPSESGRGTSYDAINAASLGATSGAIFRVVLDGAQDFTTALWDTNRTWSDIFKAGDAGSDLSIASIFTGSVEYYNSSGAVSSIPSTQGTFTLSGTSLNRSAVPEPSSALGGLLLGAGLLRRRRAS